MVMVIWREHNFYFIISLMQQNADNANSNI
jgi:hypothetical protein